MDKIQFAHLVSYISSKFAITMNYSELHNLEDIVKPNEVIVTEPAFNHIQAAQEMRNMITAIKAGRKIDAIRSHRMITKEGLKESKDEIERLMS